MTDMYMHEWKHFISSSLSWCDTDDGYVYAWMETLHIFKSVLMWYGWWRICMNGNTSYLQVCLDVIQMTDTYMHEWKHFISSSLSRCDTDDGYVYAWMETLHIFKPVLMWYGWRIRICMNGNTSYLQVCLDVIRMTNTYMHEWKHFISSSLSSCDTDMHMYTFKLETWLYSLLFQCHGFVHWHVPFTNKNVNVFNDMQKAHATMI